jgi:hypothetical protein
MRHLDLGQVVLEQRAERGGKGGEAVFASLARYRAKMPEN